ncbi:protein of unknown function [Mucilaginibacter gossypiicola]|uniref:DUF922 domain-containing protein n=1 Tax=Mucilaginibacter gossypiicola TaxID=551995 RepID=A0A1H8T684_9SPHI|nr:DUF922 domain-containing protein [Mucilaginibacter gossypiicola]SEO86451.1 protein of unknown function [Mucilaginibacter gossypiicola]
MNRVFNSAGLWLPVMLYMLVFYPLNSKAQKTNAEIVLTNRQLNEKPNEFYIANVIDERAERNAVAWLLPVPGNAAVMKYKVDLQGGAATAVKQFTDYAIAVNKTLRPVVVRIKKLKLNEMAMPDGRIEGRLEIQLWFELKKDEGNVHLVDYPAATTYYRSTEQQYDTGVLISRALGAGFEFFNKWVNREADTNIKLAKGVKLIFTDYSEQPEGDTIYYSAKRPLTWNDFQDKARGGKYVAEVMPGFGYTEQVEVIKAIVAVRISMKVFLPKSAAWVKPEGRTTFALNHEQRHFDIVAIVARHFKQALMAMKLPVDNYDGYINVQYLDSYREMNQLQEQYDNETNHGTNQYYQQEWNTKIDGLLRGD